MKNGGSFHSYVNVYQRVRENLQENLPETIDFPEKYMPVFCKVFPSNQSMDWLFLVQNDFNMMQCWKGMERPEIIKDFKILSLFCGFKPSQGNKESQSARTGNGGKQHQTVVYLNRFLN